jgi:hypothetical protein
MIKEYQKITTIKAEQFDGSEEQIERYGIRPPRPKEIASTADAEWQPLIPTKEGMMKFHIGDWIATGPFGEHYAISEAIFDITYRPVEAAK